MPASSPQRVLILGGGYVGLYTALGILKDRGPTRFQVTVVDPNPYMTYQPLLPEVAGGHVAPRDVTVPLKRTLRQARVLRGSLESLSLASKHAVVRAIDGSTRELDYDQVVFALGAVTRVFPTPGLEQNAVGFKTVEEAVYTRNRVLESIALAATTQDADARRKYLTFVFIGGGYTGVEALAELHKLSLATIRTYPNLDESDLRWVLVEALDRVAPEVGPELSKWTLGELRDKGIEILLKTTMKSCIDGEVVLSEGEPFFANTIVWTAGVQPNPVLDDTDVPRGPKGHINANAKLQVIREDGTVIEGAWAAGDNAQVPDLTKETQPAFYPPNAQNALRQAKLLGVSIPGSLRGEPIEEYRHTSLGTIASFGIGDGAALIMGVKLRGWPAWVMHRLYHGVAMPTLNRKVRIFAGWIVEAITRPDVTSLEAVENPRRSFEDAYAAATKGRK